MPKLAHPIQQFLTRFVVCTGCLAFLSAFDLGELKATLATIPTSVSNEQLADYLSETAVAIDQDKEGLRTRKFTKWTKPIRVRLVDYEDKSLPVETDIGLLVANWVSRLRTTSQIDIKLVSSDDRTANAAIVVAAGNSFGNLGRRGIGDFTVEHDGVQIPVHSSSLASSGYRVEMPHPPSIYCGKMTFGDAIGAFSIEVRDESNSARGSSDRGYWLHLINAFLGACLAHGLGIQGFAQVGSNLDSLVKGNPAPFLALLYAIDVQPGQSQQVIRGRAIKLLSALRK